MTKDPKSIVIIDPGCRVPELDCFNRISQLSALPCSYHLPALFGQGSLRALEYQPTAIIILGSGASVHDSLPWQDALRSWLLPHLAGGLPILGLCYGHQLIAHLSGARVGFITNKQKGSRIVDLEENALWGEAIKVPLIVSHREIVETCPKDFMVTGRSQNFDIEALQHQDKPIWTFQAHPEATHGFLENQDIALEQDKAEEAMSCGYKIMAQFLQRVG